MFLVRSRKSVRRVYHSAVSVLNEEVFWPVFCGSDDDGLLVFAEDAAEGIGDFADGGVGCDGGEDGGEEIFGGGGAALEFGEGGFCTDRITVGAESVQAGNLGALDFGVDAECGNGARIISLRWGDEVI